MKTSIIPLKDHPQVKMSCLALNQKWEQSNEILKQLRRKINLFIVKTEPSNLNYLTRKAWSSSSGRIPTFETGLRRKRVSSRKLSKLQHPDKKPQWGGQNVFGCKSMRKKSHLALLRCSTTTQGIKIRTNCWTENPINSSSKTSIFDHLLPLKLSQIS